MQNLKFCDSSIYANKSVKAEYDTEYMYICIYIYVYIYR